ncbi:MAG: beta-propeller domain-containing protein [Candidatus Bathyarchaeota archaeon]|nr:MAG: beta-propeller domain-containing protein [Candidatus Bathyarchaeota archaeon]
MKLLNYTPNLLVNRRKILASGLMAFLGGALLGALILNFVQMPPYFASGQPLSKFSSYEELVNFLNASSSYTNYRQGEFWALDAAKGAETTAPEYSTTNIQVLGVDEADIVKTDGEHIYIISNQSIYILKAYPSEEAEVLAQIKVNGTLHGMFLNNDKLVVLGSSYYEWGIMPEIARSYRWPYSTPRTFIKVYDVSNKTHPISTRNVTLDGSYFSSRMIGNYAYTVISEVTWLNGSEVKLPVIHHNDLIREVPATDIHYSNVTDYGYVFTTIIAVNVQNDDEVPTDMTILVGYTGNMYVSLNNIFITLFGYSATLGVEKTLIYRIHVDGSIIESEANGEVPGRVLNQFSMDEYNGHFRIATTTGWGGNSQNHVYVLNSSLGIVGRLEDLAQGETIYSARFMGSKFYLVTFRKVDPLFVIDLQNPEKPIVLGALKVTGYSDYLHPYDENLVIGIGKETEAAVTGDFAWYQGVKISLFDVSDPLNPTEVTKDEIGDRGTDSPVLRDHKAFLFDKEKQLLVIPVLVAEIDETKYPGDPPPNAYGDYIWQGAYIYNITSETLELRGNITHIENGTSLQSSYYHYSPYSVKRALYIGNILYTISDMKIKLHSLENLEEIGEIELP